MALGDGRRWRTGQLCWRASREQEAKRASLDKEATVAGYLGANVDRAALPAELQEDEDFLLGFGEDTNKPAGR